METRVFAFEENKITFNLEKDNNVMVNATEMAKVFGKDLFQFTKSEGTKSFIESCLKPANAGLLGVKSEDDLIISKQKSGTFMHRILALKFAAWLSPDFDVWVFTTIEKLLFGNSKEREASFKRTIALQNEADKLRDKPNKSGEDFERFLEISRKLNQEKSIRKNLTTESVQEIKIFNDEDYD
jgi:hypothetical protein